jgi:hypothetical protein
MLARCPAIFAARAIAHQALLVVAIFTAICIAATAQNYTFPAKPRIAAVAFEGAQFTANGITFITFIQILFTAIVDFATRVRAFFAFTGMLITDFRLADQTIKWCWVD